MLLSSQNGTWYDNPSSGMSFYNLRLTEASASYLFDNEEGLIVYGYGFGSYISYYYMAASSIRQLNPSFYINDVHFQNANGQTYCNGSFKFKAELNFPLSANPGHIKWYVNGVEEPTAQDKIEWTKSSFPLKTPQEIKLVVIGEDGKQLTIKSTANWWKALESYGFWHGFLDWKARRLALKWAMETESRRAWVAFNKWNKPHFRDMRRPHCWWFQS